MRITELEVIPVSLENRVPFRDAYGIYNRVDHIITKVITEEGFIGIGEGSPIDPSFTVRIKRRCFQS